MFWFPLCNWFDFDIPLVISRWKVCVPLVWSSCWKWIERYKIFSAWQAMHRTSSIKWPMPRLNYGRRRSEKDKIRTERCSTVEDSRENYWEWWLAAALNRGTWKKRLSLVAAVSLHSKQHWKQHRAIRATLFNYSSIEQHPTWNGPAELVSYYLCFMNEMKHIFQFRHILISLIIKLS